MANPFIGLPISVELSNGTVVEGTVLHIDQSAGKLKLSHARYHRFDGSLSSMLEELVVDKDSVKDLTLLSVKPNVRTPNSSSNHTQDHPSYRSPPSSIPQSDSRVRQAAPRRLSHHESTQPTSNHDRFPAPLFTPSIPLPVKDGLPAPTTSLPQPNPTMPTQRGTRTSHNGSNGHGPIRAGPVDEPKTHGAQDKRAGASTPIRSPPAALRSNPETARPQESDFNLDFDFQAGLQAFDKAKLWAELAMTDSTNPADRLVAYNRKQTNRTQHGHDHAGEPTRSRNLAPNEMVLSAEEQRTNGMTVSASYATPSNTSDHVILSPDGYRIYPVSLERLNRALSKASVELGPNLAQRIENAARTMAEYVMRLLRQSHGTSKTEKRGPISLLVNCRGPKGSCAIRAATLLSIKAFRVVVFLGKACGDTVPNGHSGAPKSPFFGFQLRLLEESGAEIVNRSQELPPAPALIIEALGEISNQPIKNPAVDQALIAYTHCAPTVGIDIPSFVNYDTGEPLAGLKYIPSHQYLVCLAALPQGVLKLDAAPSEVCLADLTLPDACWIEDHEGDGDDSKTPRQLFNGVDPAAGQASPPPASWGDNWYTLLKV